MAPGDLDRSNALVAAACRADVEGRVILGAVRDDGGAIVDMEFLEATVALPGKVTGRSCTLMTAPC